MPNLFDVEDSWMQGSVEFDKVIAEFEAEWNEPMIIMAAGLDMWLNQDIYLGGVDNAEETSTDGLRDASAVAVAEL